MSTDQITRNKIAEKDKWRLEDIFESDQSWEDAFSNLKAAIPKLAQFKGTIK